MRNHEPIYFGDVLTPKGKGGPGRCVVRGYNDEQLPVRVYVCQTLLWKNWMRLTYAELRRYYDLPEAKDPGPGRRYRWLPEN